MTVEMREKSESVLQERRKEWLSAIGGELKGYGVSFRVGPQVIEGEKYDQVYNFNHGGCFVFLGFVNAENFQFRYIGNEAILDKTVREATAKACLCIRDMLNESVIVFDKDDLVGEEIALRENELPSIKVGKRFAEIVTPSVS